MSTYTCPGGHTIVRHGKEAPECLACGLTASWWDFKCGVVFRWLPTSKVKQAQAQLAAMPWRDTLDEFCRHYQ